ncbi:MAG: class I SAM-dependent methyltransferase [Candidatus Omnitrophota bacterium]
MRSKHEREFGAKIAAEDTERIWGWGTPAGKVRARRRARKIIAGARIVPEMQVLEIGCGTGIFTEFFAQTGAQIIAIDISPDLLEKAKRRGLPTGQVGFKEQNFQDIDVKVCFDAIIGSSVLHHLNLEKALKKMRELLKPGGVISFAEPNMLNPQVFLERKLRFMKIFSYVTPDETAFVRAKLARLLSNMGFVDVQIEPFGWLHPAIPTGLIDYVTKIERVLEKIPLMREFAGSLYIFARVPKK